MDRDAIFVPIGWDSPSKIALLSDGNYYYCFNGAISVAYSSFSANNSGSFKTRLEFE